MCFVVEKWKEHSEGHGTFEYDWWHGSCWRYCTQSDSTILMLIVIFFPLVESILIPCVEEYTVRGTFLEVYFALHYSQWIMCTIR